MQAFSYATKRGRVQVRKYFKLPPALFDNAEQFYQWAREALAVASRPSGK